MLSFRRLSCNNIVFIIVSAAVFTFFQNIAFLNKVIHLLNMDDKSSYLLICSFIIFLFCSLNILFSLLLIGYLRKPIIILLLFLGALVDYFSYFYDIYIDKDMIKNVLQTTVGEAGSLITVKLITWIIAFALLPSLLVAVTKINITKPWHRNLGLRLTNIIISAIILVAAFYPFYDKYVFFIKGKTNNQIVKLITPYNYIEGSIRYVKELYKKRQPFIHIGQDAKREKIAGHKKKLLILVVGETSRAMNFSLNGYQKETNPLLAKQQAIINFHNATSCGTATAVSVPCMFSVMNRVNYKASIAERQDNVLDILSKTGVNLLWKENDEGCKGVCNRIPNIELKQIFPKEQCYAGLCFDISLLTGLDDYIKARTDDTLIVLHTNGSHGPAYFRRYQKLQEKFIPACSTSAVETCSKEELINAYDNTIVNVDYVLNEVIELLKKHADQYSTAMFYMSDHGESLGEKGVFLHGAPYIIAPKEQTQIPMIFWLSDSFLKDQKINKDCMFEQANNLKVSHDNLFHSLLGAMNVVTNVYEPSLDLFRACQSK